MSIPKFRVVKQSELSYAVEILDGKWEHLDEFTDRIDADCYVSFWKRLFNEAFERAAQAVLAGQKQEASGDCTSHANWELRFAAKRIRALKGE